MLDATIKGALGMATKIKTNAWYENPCQNHVLARSVDKFEIVRAPKLEVVQDNDIVVGFEAATRITTANGESAIADIKVGDRILTRDNGVQVVRWIGSKTVSGQGYLAPILIREGALGNTRDVRVSPQHRMLLQGWKAEMLFGDSEVLAAANVLINDLKIRAMPCARVTYMQMLFDDHEIVRAEGCWTESYQPDAANMAALDVQARSRLLDLFPELQTQNTYGCARFSIKEKDAKSFFELV